MNVTSNPKLRHNFTQFHESCDFNIDLDVQFLFMQGNVKNFENELNNERFSEHSGFNMARIPSTCDQCHEVLPSKNALLAHKAKNHPKPRSGVKKNDSVVVMPSTSASGGAVGPKTPKTPKNLGSTGVMDAWISGRTRSNEIGQAIARSRMTRQDTPAAAEPEERFNSLDESLNLLDDPEIQVDPASPFLATIRVYPPGAENDQDKAKMKRGREKDEDDIEPEPEKKTDAKKTPEAMKGPANMNRGMVLTSGSLDMEFDSVEPKDWVEESSESQAATQILSQPESQPESESQQSQAESVNTEASNAESAQSNDTLTPAEQHWLTSSTFGEIPPAEGQDMETEEQEDAEPNSLELEEGWYDEKMRYIGVNNELRVKLDESESQRQDYWEAMQHQETRLADLEFANKRLEDENKRLEAEKSKLDKEKKDTKAALVKHQQESIKMAKRAGQQLVEISKKNEDERKQLAMEKEAAVNRAKELEVENKKLQDKIVKTDQETRTENERMKAINTKMVGELKKLQSSQIQMQNSGAEITELKSALARVEVELEKERFKAQKATELNTRLEEIIREAQEDRAIKEQRNKDLEHKNRELARKQPCGFLNCDYSCGRDHHCGQGPNRPNRPRNRSQRRGSNPSPIPTVNNLADMAGSTVEAMSDVVNSVQRQQQQQAAPRAPPPPPPHPRSNSRNRKNQKEWKVTVCYDYHYLKCCPRGSDCRNAHELVGANTMAQGGARPKVVTEQPRQLPPLPGSGARPRSSKPPPAPAFNPDHPWVKAQNQAQNQAQGQARTQASGNAQGQRAAGAAPVRTSQPQTPARSSGASALGPFVTQAEVHPQPRTYSQVASGNSAARQTVRDSVVQQASTEAQLTALSETSWLEAMGRAFGNTQLTSTSTESPSRSQPQPKQDN